MFDSIKNEAKKRRAERKEADAAIESEKARIEKAREKRKNNIVRQKIKIADTISSKIEGSIDEKKIEDFKAAQEDKIKKAREERRQQMTKNNKGKIIVGGAIVVVALVFAFILIGGSDEDHKGQAKTPSGSSIQH